MGEAPCSIQPMAYRPCFTLRAVLEGFSMCRPEKRLLRRNTTYIPFQLLAMSDIHTGKWGQALTQEIREVLRWSKNADVLNTPISEHNKEEPKPCRDAKLDEWSWGKMDSSTLMPAVWPSTHLLVILIDVFLPADHILPSRYMCDWSARPQSRGWSLDNLKKSVPKSFALFVSHLHRDGCT